jgi:hypothetical protein
MRIIPRSRQITCQRSHQTIARWIVGINIFTFCLLFFPWTQNIQSKGKLPPCCLSIGPKPWQANIDGRIEMWYVQEGGRQLKKGIPLLFISEIKTEYGDPHCCRVPSHRSQRKNRQRGLTKVRLRHWPSKPGPWPRKEILRSPS